MRHIKGGVNQCLRNILGNIGRKVALFFKLVFQQVRRGIQGVINSVRDKALPFPHCFLWKEVK